MFSSLTTTPENVGISHWMIRQIICRSQTISHFRARGGYSGFHKTAHEKSDPLAKPTIEFEDYENVLENFRSFDLVESIEGQQLLDYGCGYGGRTAWFAQHAAHVEGIEVRRELVETAKAFACNKDVSNVGFKLSEQTRIPYEDNSFDIAVSFDVLEHVQDPRETLDELMRVVKPGGRLVIVFTPYYGIFSHHLNYISLFPGLHWFFSPKVLVDAVNDLMEFDPQFSHLGMPHQPAPSKSFNGKRLCLPSLNGLTRSEYLDLVHERNLEIEHLRSTPILEKFSVLGKLGKAFNNALHAFPGGKEMFSHNLVSVLRVGQNPGQGGVGRNDRAAA